MNTSERSGRRLAFAGVGAILALAAAVVGCSSGSGDNPIEIEGPLAHDYACQNGENQGDRCTKDCTNTCGIGSRGSKYCTCSGGVYIQCACRPPATWGGADTAPYCDRQTGLTRYLNGGSCTVEGDACLGNEPQPEEVTEQVGCRCTPVQLNPVLPPVLLWSCKPKSELELPDSAPDCQTKGTGMEEVLKEKGCDTEYDQCVVRNYVVGTSPRGCVCLTEGATLKWKCSGTNRWFRPE